MPYALSDTWVFITDTVAIIPSSWYGSVVTHPEDAGEFSGPSATLVEMMAQLPIQAIGWPAYPRYGQPEVYNLIHKKYLQVGFPRAPYQLESTWITRKQLAHGGIVSSSGNATVTFQAFCSPQVAILPPPPLPLSNASRSETLTGWSRNPADHPWIHPWTSSTGLQRLPLAFARHRGAPSNNASISPRDVE